MKNLMKKKLLPSAVSVVLAAGIGFSGGVQAIHLSENGIGQVLLAPLYLANGGYTSEIAVVNTNPNTAVKAKVVIRSQVESEELLDFICYLTPSDVCRFELVRACGTLPARSKIPVATLPLHNNCDESSKYTFMYSKDDSIKSPVEGNKGTSTGNLVDSKQLVDSLENTLATFASIEPVVRGLKIPDSQNNGDRHDVGHIEVIGVYGVQNGYSDDTGPNSVPVQGFRASGERAFIMITEGMSKFSLAQIFDAPRNSRYYFKDLHRPIAESPAYHLEPIGALNVATGATTVNRNYPYEYVERREIQRVEDAGPDGIVGTSDDTVSVVVINALDSLQFSRIRSTDPEWVRLTGTVEMKRMDSGRLADRMGYRIPSLAGSIGDNAVPGSRETYAQWYDFRSTDPNRVWSADLPANTAQFDGLVISDPEFDASIVQVSGIGERFGTSARGTSALSKTVEIEMALAATELQGVYRDDSQVVPPGNDRTNLVVTFPTRYLHRANICGVAPSQNPFTQPFNADGSVIYTLTGYDDFENPSRMGGVPFSPPQAVQESKLVEVNYFLPTWPSTVIENGRVIGNDHRQGWFRMELRSNIGCPYVGVPVLGMVHKFTDYGVVGNSQLIALSHQPPRHCGGQHAVDPLCQSQKEAYPADLVGGVRNSQGNMNPANEVITGNRNY